MATGGRGRTHGGLAPKMAFMTVALGKRTGMGLTRPVPDGGPTGSGGPRNGFAVLHCVPALTTPSRRRAGAPVGCAGLRPAPADGPP